MPKTKLPRFFVGKADDEPSPGPSSPVRIVDHFVTAGRHHVETEYIVAVDMAGNMVTVGENELQDGSSDLQAQLAFSNVTQPMTRALAINQFYLFSVELIERPADAPGINDPIYLYGNIVGPVPENTSATPIPGQLTVTRADLLAGILASAPYAFHYDASGTGQTWSRCFSLLLPGGREDEILRGDSIVLAYPMPPSDVFSIDGSNEMAVAQLLYDILTDLKAESALHEARHQRLSGTIIPVPSRAALEAQLEAKGYVIKGDFAIRKGLSSNKFAGALEGIFGSFMKDKLELPPQGTFEQLLDIAKYTLETMPGWPPTQTRALRNLCQKASAELLARASSASSTFTALAPCGNTPQLAKKRVHDWLRDFANARTGAAPDYGADSEYSVSTASSLSGQKKPTGAQGNFVGSAASSAKSAPVNAANPPKNKGAAKPLATQSKSGAKRPLGQPEQSAPSWLDDFSDEPDIPKTEEKKKKQSKNDEKPAEWMDDFK